MREKRFVTGPESVFQILLTIVGADLRAKLVVSRGHRSDLLPADTAWWRPSHPRDREIVLRRYAVWHDRARATVGLVVIGDEGCWTWLCGLPCAAHSNASVSTYAAWLGAPVLSGPSLPSGGVS